MRKYILLLFCLPLVFVFACYIPVYAGDPLTVQVGIYENEPKIFSDENGAPAGFWPDIIQYIAGEEGWEIEYISGTWEQCLQRLKNNEIDIMPDMAFSDERADVYYISSESVYVSWSSVYIQAGTSIESIIDLEGKTVAVLKGSINVIGPEGIKALTSSFSVDCSFTEVNSYLDVFSMVERGDADAGVASKDFANLHKDVFNLVSTPIVFSPVDLRFAFTKNAEITPYLAERCDYHIRNLKTDQSSILHKAMNNWLGVTPVGKTIFPEWAKWLLIGIGGMVVTLAAGASLLRLQVRNRTRKLGEEIEERTHAEEKLLESERTLKLVSENTQDIICLHSADYKYVYVSPSCKYVLGYNPEELIGADPWELVHPEDIERIQVLGSVESEKGEPVSLEYRIRCKSGEYKWFESVSSTLLNDAGSINGFVTSSRDISLRKQKEMEYATILAATLDGFWVCDNKGNFFDVNNAYCKLIGYSRDELLKMNISNVEAIENVEETQARIAGMRETGGDRFETRHICKDGAVIDVEISANFIDLQGGRVIVFVRDVTERKRFLALLTESEEKYKSLVEYNDDAVLLTTPDGGIEAANPAACRIFGRTEQEICEAGRSGILDPADPRLIPLLEERRRTGKARGLLTFIKKDGTSFTGEVTSVLFTDNEGRTKTSMVIRDITEREKAEDELLLRARLLDNASDGICLFNQQGEYVYVNEMYCNTHGYSREELLGTNIREIDSHATDGWMDWLRNEMKQKGVVVFESTHFRRDGSEIHLEVHSTEIEAGSSLYNLSVERDITERKRMETALRESEEKFSEVFYANPKPMTIVEPNTGIINDANQAFFRISGFIKEECIGKTMSELGLWVSEKDRREFVQKLMELESVQNLETPMRTKSGEIRDVFFSTTRISISDKFFTIISTDDITERKRMQENLIVTDRLASVGELAAGIAHELNNPLTGVIGFSDLLMERDDIPEDVMGDISIINKEAVRASQVARHLLTFARKHPDEKKPVNINSVIWLVMELRAYEQRVNNIEVISNLAEDLPLVMANDFQLQQVFINIIINAEHFMLEANGKGRLTITTEHRENSVRISIIDNGPGITSENLNRIFDPFYTTKEVGKGTGLGLSICYGIITEHGGRIWAESEPGNGATFLIELPCETFQT